MSKAILVMDMPESCVDCQLRRKGYCEPYSWNNPLCGVYNNLKNNSKPEWCPLVPIPEKMQVCGKYPQSDRIVPSYKAGWNACIDAMEGGVNKNEV